VGGNEATATLTDRSLAPGVQALTAVYGGDLVNQESTSAPVDFSVGDLSRNVTSTSVAVPSGNLAAHQSVALTANVAITVPTGSPGTAAPTGTVTFLDGAVSLGSLGFVAGASTAAFTTTLILPDGTSVVDTQTVNLANSASAANTASWKDSVIAGTETVSTSAGGTTATFTTSVDGSTLAGTEQVTTAGGIPTATFAISLDGATLMNWSTADGVVTTALGTQALSDGAHFITALYSGDLGNLSSTAAPVIVQVGQKTTVTSLSNTVVVGQPVVATVTIQGGGAGAPTGTVTFIEGSTTFIAPVVDVGGVGTATWTSLSLAPGNYPITAQYNGDADDAVSSSGPTTVAIAKDLTQVSVTTPSPTSIAGTVTLTAAVTAVLPGQGTPTGSVTFYDGATALGSAQPLIQGSVTYTATISSAGTQTITANYSGDTADAPASGTLLLTIVNAGGGGGRDQVNATTTTLSLPSQATLGQSVTLTAVVSGSGTGTISGTLSFYDGTTLLQTRALSNGGATAPLVISSPSTHSITAIFVTDGSDFASSSSGPSVIQIVPDATQTALSVQSNPGYVGQPESLKAVVAVQSPGAGTPTGSVTFYDGPLPIGVAPLQTGSGDHAIGRLPLDQRGLCGRYQRPDELDTPAQLDRGSDRAKRDADRAFTAFPVVTNVWSTRRPDGQGLDHPGGDQSGRAVCDGHGDVFRRLDQLGDSASQHQRRHGRRHTHHHRVATGLFVLDHRRLQWRRQRYTEFLDPDRDHRHPDRNHHERDGVQHRHATGPVANAHGHRGRTGRRRRRRDR
jgi:hypothetical protein